MPNSRKTTGATTSAELARIRTIRNSDRAAITEGPSHRGYAAAIARVESVKAAVRSLKYPYAEGDA